MGGGGGTAVALALLLFSNQRRLEAAHTSRPKSHKFSSPSLFLLFLLRQPSFLLLILFARGYSTSRSNSGAARQRLWLFKAPRRRDSSSGAGSSKGVMAWAQAPPRQRRHGPTTVDLDLGRTGLDPGSGVFVFEN
jgi:hypothetical protein